MSFFTTVAVITIIGALILVGVLVLLLREVFAHDEEEIVPPSRPWLDDDE